MSEDGSLVLPSYTPEQLSRVRLENACVAYQARIERMSKEFAEKEKSSARIVKELTTQVQEFMPLAKRLEEADELLAQKNATLGMLTEKLASAEKRALDLEEELRYERGRRFQK